MPKVRAPFFDLTLGQSDTRVVEGQELPSWRVYQNLRSHEGGASARKGWKRLDTATSIAATIDFDGTDQYISIPLHVEQGFGASQNWTMEFCFQADVVTGEQPLIAFDQAASYPYYVYLDGTTLTVYLENVTPANISLTSTVAADTPYAVQVRRNGKDFALYVNGTLADSSTTTWTNELESPGQQMLVAKNNGGDYFNGKLAYWRAYRYTASHNKMAWTYWPTPHLPYMVFDYVGILTDLGFTSNYVLDRSPYENHGTCQNTPTAAAAITDAYAPVQLIRGYRSEPGETKILVTAGQSVYAAEV